MSHQKKFHKKILCIKFFITILILLYFSLGTSFGQSQMTNITVTVTDSGGAAVSGATVSIKKKGSDQFTTQTTDSNGLVTFKTLDVGIYDITVELGGFKKLTRENVTAFLGQSLAVSIVLEASPDTTVVGLSSSDDEQSDKLSQLPNFNNDLTPILQVITGAIPAGSNQLGRVIIDGKGKDTTSIRLDGVDATPQIDLPTADSSLDVIDSFQKPGVAFNSDSTGRFINDNDGKLNSAFAAQYGPGTGIGLDNSTLRAVSEWRAQLNVEHLNNAFNARNFFDYFGKNGVQRTRLSAKAGGTLNKDGNSFLYFAYEGQRGRTEGTFFEAVPSEAVCRCGVNGLIGSFLGNYLPSGTGILPNASLNPDFLVAQRRGRTMVESNAGNIRFDHTISEENFLTLRYTPQLATAIIPDGITGRRQKQKISFHNFLASFTNVPNSTFTSTIRFGINNTKAQAVSENPVALSSELTRSLISLSGNVTAIGLPGKTSVPVATIGSLIKGIGRGYDLDPKSYSLSYNAVLSSFKDYNILFGAEARFIRLSFDRLGGINYSFSNLNAFRAGLPTSTNFLSDLSEPSPFSDFTGRRHVRQNYFLSYIQATRQYLNQRLTLTYGLRYDYFSGVKERDNRVFLIDPETGSVLPSTSALIRAQSNNLQPRFGLTYKFSEEGSFRDTLFSLGVGIYSGSPKISDLMVAVESDRLNTTINGGNFTTGIDSVLHNFREQTLTRQFQPLAISRNFLIPEKLYKWEAALKKTVFDGYELIFSYLGNVGRQLPVAYVGNRIVSVTTNPDPTQPARVVREFDIVSNGEVLKPFGEFYYRSTDGRSNYNALSVHFKTNNKGAPDLPRWLDFKFLSVQYTYALNKGNTSGAVASNPSDLDADYGFNSSDVRHSFSLSATYRLWKAVGNEYKYWTSFWRGWQFAPALTARSGMPLIIRMDRPDVVYTDSSGNFFSTPAVGRTARLNIPGGGAGAGAQVPNLIPNVNPYSSNDRLTLLNPAAFAIPSPGSLGNLRRGELRGPNYVSLDLGISRFFLNKERYGAEFRVDFFNVFNRANFINPAVSLPNALGTSTENNQIQPGSPYTRLSAGSFGIVSAADFGRRVQFSLIFKLKDGFLGREN